MMSVISEHWIELREVPDDESRLSYVRLQDIERISLMEAKKNEFPIYILVLGEEYSYTTVETLHEAQLIVKGIIEDIERSKLSKQ